VTIDEPGQLLSCFGFSWT